MIMESSMSKKTVTELDRIAAAAAATENVTTTKRQSAAAAVTLVARLEFPASEPLRRMFMKSGK